MGAFAEFERALGVKLFERKPFRLTDPGRMLQAHVGPFYEGLAGLWGRMRTEPAETVCIGIDEMLAEEFLPAIAAAIMPRWPALRLEFRTGHAARLESWLHEREVHLAIATAERHVRGFHSRILARVGLRLLVARKARIKSPGHFWRQARIAEPLIGRSGGGTVDRIFERGLRALQVVWPAGVRVDSTGVMIKLVGEGHGVGVGLELPSQTRHPKIRALPLTGFAGVPLVALWRPSTRPYHESLLMAASATARKLWPALGLIIGAGRRDEVSRENRDDVAEAKGQGSKEKGKRDDVAWEHGAHDGVAQEKGQGSEEKGEGRRAECPG